MRPCCAGPDWTMSAFVAMLMLLASLASVCVVPGGAWAHDIYEVLTHGSACSCGNVPLAQLCQPVEAVPLGGDLYYLPASGEQALATGASPDERFHRCTWPLNMQWHSRGVGQGAEGWIEVPNRSTLDGKPATRCLFVPQVLM